MRGVTFVLLLLFALPSNAQSRTPVSYFSLRLERIGCLGICPWYNITILQNGSVRYEGRAYVHVEGVRNKKITATKVNELIQKLRDEDFFHWTEKTELCVDYPQVRIAVHLNGQRKRVVEGCNTPGKILTLADEIDTISDTKDWIGTVGEELLRKQQRSASCAQVASNHGTVAEQIQSAMANARTSKTATERTEAAERLAELTKSMDRKAVSEQTISDLISLLDSPDDSVRFWVAAALGNLGQLAKAAIPKLQELLPNADCLDGTITSASGIRYALKQMGVTPPPPPNCTPIRG